MQETKALKKQMDKNKIVLILYALTSAFLTIPTIIYFIKGKGLYAFRELFSYFFVITDNQIIKDLDALSYISLFLILFILYFIILKKHNKIFKNIKEIFIFISIIGILFVIVIPSTSLDVYSYIGNGWADAHYGENPYYTPVEEILLRDGLDQMLGRVARVWRTETVIYGPAWSVVCKILTSLSFGNLEFSLYIFKIASFLVFLGSTYLIYKITNKKFFTIMFGLNPFILFEFLTNVHNDIFLVFFILLGIYFIKNKRNIYLAVASLAIATAMKYLSILLLPFLLAYALKDENVKDKIKKIILCAIEFIAIIVALYLIYLRDFNVLAGIFIQQNKYGRSIPLILWYLLNGDEKALIIVKIVSLTIFAIAYITIICKILFSKKSSKITFRKTIQTYQVFLLAFTFLLITNFNAWYVVWLFPTLMWQKAKNIRLTLYLSIGVLTSYTITYVTGQDGMSVGIPYLMVMVLTVLLLDIIRKVYINIRNRKNKEIGNGE